MCVLLPMLSGVECLFRKGGEGDAAMDDVPACDGEMEADAATRADAAGGAPAAPTAPAFASSIAACLPAAAQEQLTALEAANMAGFTRNGDAFDRYFTKWDLTVHTVRSADGQLLGFAISGLEGRGKAFLYELHVAADARSRGFGRALIDLVERSATRARGGGGGTVELHVHKSNIAAQEFYEHLGFVLVGEASEGRVLVMQRKR